MSERASVSTLQHTQPPRLQAGPPLYCMAGADPPLLSTLRSLTSTVPPDSCKDRLVFRNGDELTVNVIELNNEEMMYRRCDIPDGPTYLSSTALLFSVTFESGLTRVFTKKEQAIPPQAVTEKPGKVNGFALASFICSIPFFLVFPLVLSLIFGIIGLVQMKNEPTRYKAKWMAVLGTIMGGIAVAILMLFLIAAFV